MGREMIWVAPCTVGTRTWPPHWKARFFSPNSEFSNRFLSSRSSYRSGTPSLDLQKSRGPLHICDHYCVCVWGKDQQTLSQTQHSPASHKYKKELEEMLFENSSCGLVESLWSRSEFWLFSFPKSDSLSRKGQLMPWHGPDDPHRLFKGWHFMTFKLIKSQKYIRVFPETKWSKDLGQPCHQPCIMSAVFSTLGPKP